MEGLETCSLYGTCMSDANVSNPQNIFDNYSIRFGNLVLVHLCLKKHVHVILQIINDFFQDFMKNMDFTKSKYVI